MKTNDRFAESLMTLPRPGNGYHPRLLGVANIGIRAGLSPADVAAAIRAHTQPGGRHVADGEISDAVRKAASDYTGRPFKPARWHDPRPVQTFDAAAFMAERQAEAAGIEEPDLWESSPIRIDWPPEQDAVEVLQRLYDPADVLFLGAQYGTEVKPASAWLADIAAGRPIPPHIIPNPLTGQNAHTKDGKWSFRADACVKSFRFCVAEFDGLSRENQVRFWWAVNLPVCALIDSGGKSLHAWIKIDGVKTAEQWSDLVESKLFGRFLIPLGCDAACRNESRLSRMPGHFRAEKQRWQRILYLAPDGRRVNP